MRTLSIVGRLQFGARTVAIQCAWCGQWKRVRDHVLAALGAKVSHSLCPACEARHFPPEAA